MRIMLPHVKLPFNGPSTKSRSGAWRMDTMAEDRKPMPISFPRWVGPNSLARYDTNSENCPLRASVYL